MLEEDFRDRSMKITINTKLSEAVELKHSPMTKPTGLKQPLDDLRNLCALYEWMKESVSSI